MKAAAYFWMFSALMAWWRVTSYLINEAYGPDHKMTKFFPIGRTPLEKRAPVHHSRAGRAGCQARRAEAASSLARVPNLG